MMMGAPRVNAMALTSMILGILSIPMCCCQFISAPLAVTGLVLGIIGMSQIKNNPQMYKGGGFAIAGIVTASVGVLLSLLGIFSSLDESLRSRYGGGY